jgi:hypothetical protein
MKGQKLPKKYQKKQEVSISPLNVHVSTQLKLTSNELRQKNKKKEMIKQRNQNTYAKEQSYIRWVNPFTPINHNKLGSSQSWKNEKKYKYYD